MFTASYAEDRALLVGIDEYININPLTGSKQDVKNMEQFIQSEWNYKPEQILTLTDGKATRNNILNAFDNWLVRGSRNGDKVLFYYSGHGAFVGDDNRDESDDLDEALCPVDTTGSRRNLIRDDEINSRLKKLRGRKVMIIVDACHSGTITKSAFADRYVKVPFFGRHNSRPITKSGFERESLIEIQQNVIAYSAVAANQQALVNRAVAK